MQKNPAVLGHGPRDVEQSDDRRRLHFRPDEPQIDKIATAFKTGAQGAADIDDMAARMRRQPPRTHFGNGQNEPLHRFFGGSDFGVRHLREVLALQHFALGDGHAGVELDLALLFEFVFEAREQRFLDARCTGLRRARRAGRRRRHHRHELIDVAAAAEENAESLIEQDRMLVPLHEHRVQRPVKIIAGADARGRTASSASSTAPGPTGMPAARSARAK